MLYYFDSFPLTTYNGITSIDITRRVSIPINVQQNQSIYYPYTISDNETADSIAYDYYGDVNYVWLIYLINNIIDPYYDWPLSNIDFDNFITAKYGSIATALSTNLYYKQIPQIYYVDPITNNFANSSTYIMGSSNWQPITIDNDIRLNCDPGLPSPDPTIWQPVDAYTDELQKNEAKKNILLLNNQYSKLVGDQLGLTLNA
jgi:hypothetical protein